MTYYEPERWELDDLLPEPGTPEMEAYVEETEARLGDFESRRDDLSSKITLETFEEILLLYEELYAAASALSAYSYLWFSEDTASQDALAFRARIDQFVADLENRTLFFTLWWKHLEDDVAEKLLRHSGDTRYFLESLRHFRPFTLSEPVEQVINVKDVNGMNSLLKIYDMITSGFTFYLTVDGEKKEMTRGQLTSYVSTLAHELGHAVHAMMAADHSVLTFHSALPMAETASVFGEMLLTDKLLAEEQEPAVRRTLLSNVLDEAYATIARQGYFVLFEQTAHEMILGGATPDELHMAYMDNLKEQFGDALVLSDDFRLEWTAIPHIYHTPFYCYAYAFGNLLVLALYRKYKEIGKPFEQDYLRILAYGGSASPDHIIREAGFDMASPDFWQSGFDLLAEMLDDLSALVAP
ncbi:MAG: M3 family metallopeptidase [Anaerolineae bacterium]